MLNERHIEDKSLFLHTVRLKAGGPFLNRVGFSILSVNHRLVNHWGAGLLVP